MDQVFVSLNWERAIFLKLGWSAEKEFENKLVKVEDQYVFNGKLDSKTPYLLYFYNYSKSDAQKMLKKIRADVEQSKSSYSIYNLIFPRAHAAASCNSNATLKSLIETKNALQSQLLSSQVGRCVVESLDSMGESLLALPGSIKSGVTKLIDNPAAVFRTAVEKLKKLKEVARTITTSISKAYKNLSGVSPEVLKGLTCGIIRAEAGLIVRAFNPVGAAALAASLAATAKKISDYSGLLKKLSKASGPENKNLSKISEKVGMCAAM